MIECKCDIENGFICDECAKDQDTLCRECFGSGEGYFQDAGPCLKCKGLGVTQPPLGLELQTSKVERVLESS